MAKFKLRFALDGSAEAIVEAADFRAAEELVFRDDYYIASQTELYTLKAIQELDPDTPIPPRQPLRFPEGST
jgi:hypothetical protein